jgi:hypothetical protein
MSTTLNAAPPAAAPKGGDFIKLPPFKKTDSYVATILGYNYIASHPFDRTDPVTKKDYVQEAPAIELFIGAIPDGEVALLKTWPQMYSINEKSNYAKWFAAATGVAPVAGSKPDELIGKAVLVEIEVSDKVGGKGTKYIANKVKSVSKVPSILAATITPLAKLQPALDAALAGEKDGDVPF